MAWTEQCKIEFKIDVDNRKEREKISAKQAIKATAKAGGIPIKTGENWYYGRKPTTSMPQKRGKSNNVFNETNDMVGWARWTWNPYTGCEHGCKYCYARDIANRFYKEKFTPTFRPHRLKQPKLTPLPKQKGWHRRVFVCSMADLFGDWVPGEHIKQILNAAENGQDWEFLYLTKNPARLLEFDFPSNSWVGATVDTQERVESTETVFNQLNGVRRFLSIEPFTKNISFNHLNFFDLIMIGGRSRSTKMAAARPSLEIMIDILSQAKKAKTQVWIKGNVNPLE